MSFRTQILGTQRRGDGKDCASLPPKERGGRGGRASQYFSSPWGWVNFALGKPGTLAFGGNRLRIFFRLVSPAEGAGALAPARFLNSLHACVDMDRHGTSALALVHFS